MAPGRKTSFKQKDSDENADLWLMCATQADLTLQKKIKEKGYYRGALQKQTNKCFSTEKSIDRIA